MKSQKQDQLAAKAKEKEELQKEVAARTRSEMFIANYSRFSLKVQNAKENPISQGFCHFSYY